MYCPNCGGDIELKDAFCRECGAGVERVECGVCHTSMSASDADCPSCHAAPCADCDTWSLPSSRFCPGCGGQLIEEVEDEEQDECPRCRAAASGDNVGCDACGAARCPGCREWSPPASRFCHGCGEPLPEIVSQAPVEFSDPAIHDEGTASPRDLPQMRTETGETWHVMFGELMEALNGSAAEPKVVAAYCYQLMRVGIDWRTALRAAASAVGTDMTHDAQAEIEACMETTLLVEVLADAVEERGGIEDEPIRRSPGDHHHAACDTRHTARQRCNSNRSRNNAA